MSRTVLGPGARGDLVFRIQGALVEIGIPLPEVDGVYGGDSKAAVAAFQRRSTLPETGILDEVAWVSLTHSPIPDIFSRILQLTAAFEGHSYTLAMGNFDGAWLTWGIIGFTMAHGQVQKIISSVDGRNPGLMDRAFGVKAPELRRILQSPPAEQRAWAGAQTVAGGRLAEPWRSAFAAYGQFEMVKDEQRRRALNAYFTPARNTAAKFGLAHELGLALAFDIHVQNGGIGQAVAERVTAEIGSTSDIPELRRREILANAVADNARVQYREDVRSRKLAIARGSGTVHGREYFLENWGLADVPFEEG